MSWLNTSPVKVPDLVRYRTIYAAVALLLMPTFSWADEYPDSLYTPPAGPFELFNGMPAHAVLVGLELLMALSLAALLFDRWVDAASVLVSLSMFAGCGFTFSLSKIDHMFLFGIAPLFMAAAGWSGRRPLAPWVVRLFAWTVAAAMATAGFDKLRNGWLSLDTHATYAYVLSYDAWDAEAPLASSLLQVQSAWFWEPMDTAAVVLECGLLLLALNWRTFRGGLAILCIFHFSVMLMLGIAFAGNVLVYGAFVSWGAIRLPRLPRLPIWLLPVVACGAWLLAGAGGVPHTYTAVLTAGVVISLAWPLQALRRHRAEAPERRAVG